MGHHNTACIAGLHDDKHGSGKVALETLERPDISHAYLLGGVYE